MSLRSDSANDLTELAREIAKKICVKLGVAMPELREANVPPSIRHLMRHAEILGIGDDVARGEILEAVPREYLHLVTNEIAEKSELFDWYKTAEKTSDATGLPEPPEVVATGWMIFGLNL